MERTELVRLAGLLEQWERLPEGSVHVVSASGRFRIQLEETTDVKDTANIEIRPPVVSLDMQGVTPKVVAYPDVLLQATIVVTGDVTSEGHLIQGVSVAWFEIINEMERDPEFLFRIGWRKFEELVAGAYEREGWPEVVLTPRSGDLGRDVIATKPGIGSIRIIDQAKAYTPGHRVTANDVRALLGVLWTQRNVSKGVITTTSTFAPGIYQDQDLAAFVPHRLELKDGKALRQWLGKIARGSADR